MHFPDFAVFFGEKWGVEWTFLMCTSDEFSYNAAANNLFKDKARLPLSLPCIKGVYLMGFKAGDAICLPWDKDEGKNGPDQLNISKTKHEQPAESPIVYTCLGKGYLGYVGFSNGAKELTDVILAMLSL
jgi:hypothetical protein